MKRDLELPEFTGLADDLKQIVPSELAEPLERMFLTLSEIKTVRASFGKPHLRERVVVERLEGHAEEIYRACAALWRDA